MADVVAPEHLEVVTAAPRELLPYLHNAGAIFLGQYAPEPLGDYMQAPAMFCRPRARRGSSLRSRPTRF